MDERKAKGIVDYAFKDIFGRPNPFSLDEIRKRFAYDINIPERVKDSVSGKETWTVNRKAKKFMHSDDVSMALGKNTWAKPKREIRSMDDLLKGWHEINYFATEKEINSRDIAQSESIYYSTGIFGSTRVVQSKNVVFSEYIFESQYIVASLYNIASAAAMRIFDSETTASSFAVEWSAKISKSMYILNCVDMYECLFCSNLQSKKYCIGNMQFTKEEYLPIKEMVIDWTIENFGKGNDEGF